MNNFAPPLFFFLVAIPWPSALEHAVVDFLTRLNTSASVESLLWLKIPALQRGNVIELVNGIVGIDEACSGIRSIQANVMLAVFFGEYNRFNWKRRLGLVTAGLLFALIFNYGRTLLLTVIASKQGVRALDRWHDPAGVLVLLGCFTALWATSWILAQRSRKNEELYRQGGETRSANHGTANVVPPIREIAWPSFFSVRSKINQIFLVGLITWSLLIPVISETWFLFHESESIEDKTWGVAWPPREIVTAEPASISKGARAQLLFDEGGSFRWRDSSGNLWQMFYFRWLPARNIFRRTEIHLAKSHRPEICLPASGLVLKEQSLVDLGIHGVQIPFWFYEFEDRGRSLHVYLHVRDESMPIDSLANMRVNTMDRLRAAWQGNRAAGQQTLQFAVWGISDPNESRRRLEEQALPNVLKQPASTAD